jgi:hypothetical protein
MLKSWLKDKIGINDGKLSGKEILEKFKGKNYGSVAVGNRIKE